MPASSLRRNTPADAEILLIDDASDDPLIQPMLRRWLADTGPFWRLEVLPQNVVSSAQ
jgi:hypothetical protein